MVCQKVEQHLQRLLDRREGLAKFLESNDPWACHARLCPDCRELAESLQVVAYAGGGPDGFPADAPERVNLADRVVASLAVSKASATARRSPAARIAYRHRWGLASALAASLLVAVGLGRLLAPGGGEADGLPAAPQVATVAPPQIEVDQPRWYPRGVGLASLSMAVLTSPEFDRRQVSSPPDEPLLDRAIEAVRRVLPDLEPEVPANSKTGVSLPELQLGVC